MATHKRTVAVLGASPKPERYSNQAVSLLQQEGYAVFPVHPAVEEIHGLPCIKTLDDITPPLNTLTVYVNPGVSNGMTDSILRLKPERIIFNPGAENPDIAENARQAGIEVLEACTLVMLKTGQF